MRNPARIKSILSKLELIWRQYPDLRLNQLIYNLSWRGDNLDSFYLEDDVFEVILDREIEKLNKSPLIYDYCPHCTGSFSFNKPKDGRCSFCCQLLPI